MMNLIYTKPNVASRRSFLTWILLSFIIMVAQAHADVKSTSGTIEFRPQSQGTSAMTLNQTGLGIGTSPTATLHVAGNGIVSQSLSIGTTNSSANLNLGGSLSLSPQLISTNTMLDQSSSNSMIMVDTSSSNLNLTLPYAGNVEGRVITIKKISTFNKLSVYGSNTHDTFLSLSGKAASQVQAHNNTWRVLSTYGSSNILYDGQSSPHSDNLIAHWPMDGSGQDLIGGRNLTASANSASFIQGVRNQAVYFDNSLKQYYLGDFSPTLAASTEFTMSFWVSRANSNWSTWVNISSSALNSIFNNFGRRTAGNAMTQTFQDTKSDDGSNLDAVHLPHGMDFSGGDWIWITVTATDGQAAKIYANGQLALTTTKTYSSSGAQHFNLLLGARFAQSGGVRFPASFATAAIDDIRLYDKAFSLAEVQSYYQNLLMEQ